MSDTAELDAQVASAARKVRILGALSWDAEVEQAFLAHRRAGRRELPQPSPVAADTSHDAALADAIGRCDPADPRQAFIARTAESYRQALAMLASAHTPGFQRHGLALYGGPRDPIGLDGPTLHAEAEHLLQAGEALDLPVPEATVPSQQARDQLQSAIDAHFDEPLPVELDPHLGSLAAAGSQRVRLRDGIAYAPVQLEQLLQHEALVHSATKRNGQASGLATLGLSSPRTTRDQEGIATLAEMVTDTLDLQRLRRIALRVRMVDHAMQGADFLQVFEALLDAGQPEREAFRSSMRVFRGGDVRGGIAFPKDVVYLAGLRRVHSFLMAALRAHRDELIPVLFAGRLTCGDAVAMAPLWAEGTLAAPTVVPPWARHIDRLAAYLVWAAFGQRVPAMPLEAFD